MSGTLSKILMVIAIACLGDSRQGWAREMLIGFKQADAEGYPLSYASQCLLLALREMPRHAEGRETMARYGAAFGLLLPCAAILFAGAITGYPFIHLPAISDIHHASGAWMPGGVNESNRFALQTLTVLFLILSARPLITAWFLLERDWARVGSTQRFTAAIITTIALFTSVLMREAVSAALPAAMLAIELGALTIIRRWQGGSDADDPVSQPDQSTLIAG